MNLQEKDSGNLQVEDYLEAVLDNFHDGIYITDREANTVYLNHSYELISGLRKSEMIGKNMKRSGGSRRSIHEWYTFCAAKRRVCDQ